MKKIFKYPIGCAELEWFTIPIGSELLTIEMQNGFPFLWAIIDDTQAVHVMCEVLCIETGRPIPNGWDKSQFIKTILIKKDTKVYHFFGAIREETEVEPPPSELARWTFTDA